MYNNNYIEGTYKKKVPGQIGLLKDHDYMSDNPHFNNNVCVRGSIYNLRFPTKYIIRDYSFNNNIRTFTEKKLEDKIFHNNNKNLFNYKKKLENHYGISWVPPVEPLACKIGYKNYTTPAYRFIYEPDISFGSYGYKGKLVPFANNYIGRLQHGMSYKNHHYRLNENNLNYSLKNN